ncbi:MAG: hypothetical protein IH949_01400 [Bacteroidetes bacterium]|nr:hypothetical protein [Bacteroidota bacterium]
MIIDLSKKSRSIIDEVIFTYGNHDFKTTFAPLLGIGKEIEFFETLPFGKELKKAFEKMSLRFNTKEKKVFDIVMLEGFMHNFYKTLLISIDKKAKTSNDFGFNDVKKAVYKKQNQIELKKALNIFNCKIQNSYFEFSKSGFIELYTQYEYRYLKKFLELKSEKAKNDKPKTTSLKDESKSIKIYREIIKRTLHAKLDNVKHSEGREDITSAHIIDVANEIGEEYMRLENRYYKWAQNNQERFELLVLEELIKIQSNQHS